MPIGIPKIIYCWGEKRPPWTDFYNFIFCRRMKFLMPNLDDELCNQICGLLINIHIEDTSYSNSTYEEDRSISENCTLEQYTLKKITLEWLNWNAQFFNFSDEPYLFYLAEILSKDFSSGKEDTQLTEDAIFCTSKSEIPVLLPAGVLKKLRLTKLLFCSSLKLSRSPKLRRYFCGKSGIYIFINFVQGKAYAGSALDLTKRLGQHFSYNPETRKISSSIYFQNPLAKYAEKNFIFTIVGWVPRLPSEVGKEGIDAHKIRLLEREQVYLDLNS